MLVQETFQHAHSMCAADESASCNRVSAYVNITEPCRYLVSFPDPLGKNPRGDVHGNKTSRYLLVYIPSTEEKNT